ncbi:1-deoxyxylulose-5-phosphate synthase, thiamine-requiring, FAD-requiring [Syntrophobacter sp. SbD2]|nr:1-deoxyxylulose-5-phosphate synthase, thiamine-requiring, FAD-requiring [Syntrophobacter sp. SbD2]
MENKTMGKGCLSSIEIPHQLRGLSHQQLSDLAEEIRARIIGTVAENGGHLAPCLGVVELTIALHYVFDAAYDRFIWDVGHQAYAHKLLTGRQKDFGSLRQYGGISGFPKRSESRYDAFGTGHSSTSISASLGISVANHLKGSQARTIAVIGDGSMTGGMAFEGLNNAGDLARNLIVVLNDNEMSISPNVGALSSFLSRKLSGKTLMYLKREMEDVLKSIPGIGPNILQVLRRSVDSLISFFTPGMLFQALEFQYIGPINGHRLDKLITTFEIARNVDGPVLIHVLTKKGKGYEPAQKDPTRFHGVGPFDIATGKSISNGLSYTKIFGKAMKKLADTNPKLIGITAAMIEGTGLDCFAKTFPERFFDVGIAEQHAVTFAAGLATEGFKPVVAIYSTFLQRAYDQILHDVCLQNLPVVFAMDRSGIVGEDGPTHHGLFDLSYLRSMPNMVVMAPKDENELQHMLKTAVDHDGPAAVRYPRGNVIGVKLDDELKSLEIGKGELLRPGKDLVIVAIGSTVLPAIEAAERLDSEGIETAVINARFVKPLDRELIMTWAEKTGRVITVEENALMGGFGSAILEMFEEESFFPKALKRLGASDCFVPHGSQTILRNLCGIDADAIESAALKLLDFSHGQVLRAIGQTARR